VKAASSRARQVVRIQAGKWKGRRLEVPAGARPTSGRARAALFDVLGPERLASARVLDLFAGSGAVGLEAVSRGAASAILVDSDAGAVARTCARLSALPEEIRVVAGEAGPALERLSRAGERFDLVFADPPYGAGRGGAGRAMDVAAGVGRAIDVAAELLADGGVLVVQADAGETVPPPRGLRPLARRAYGRNVFHFFGIPDGSL
jgi:16S rRNA (guanine966-N2)-methyltransferase